MMRQQNWRHRSAQVDSYYTNSLAGSDHIEWLMAPVEQHVCLQNQGKDHKKHRVTSRNPSSLGSLSVSAQPLMYGA